MTNAKKDTLGTQGANRTESEFTATNRTAPLSSLISDDAAASSFFKVDYSHNMHKECLKSYLETKHSECPVCQNLIRPELWDSTYKLDMNKAGQKRVISLRSDKQLSELDTSKKTLDV